MTRHEQSSVEAERARRWRGLFARAPLAHLSATHLQHDPCQAAGAPEGTGAATDDRNFGRLRQPASAGVLQPVVPKAGRRQPMCTSAAHPGSCSKLDCSDKQRKRKLLLKLSVFNPRKRPSTVSLWHSDLLRYWRPQVGSGLSGKAVTHTNVWTGMYVLVVAPSPVLQAAFSSADTNPCLLQMYAASK